MTDRPDQLTVGTVAITRTATGWTARCSSCPWTDTAGEFGLTAIRTRAEDHHCNREE